MMMLPVIAQGAALGETAGVAIGAAGAAALAGIGLAIYAGASPRSQLVMPVIWRGDQASHDDGDGMAKGRVALTFDDGPHPEATPRVLEALHAAEAKATFFVIGRYVQRYPQLVKQIHDAGHLIGNHTFDHAYTGLFYGRQYWLDQLQRTDEVVADIIGERPTLFRPPMGFRHHRVAWAVRQSKHRVVTWSRRAMDGVACSPGAIVRRIAKPTQPGEIVLMHDGAAPASRRPVATTCDALPIVLAQWRERGLISVRVDELAELSGLTRS